MKYVMVVVLCVVLCGAAFSQIIGHQFPGPMILCPECDGEPELVHRSRKYRVQCTEHPNKHRGPKCRTADEAVCLWNAQIMANIQGECR